MRKTIFKPFLSAALTLLAAPAFALTIGSGSTMDYGNSTWGFGCQDVIVEGTLKGSSANLTGIANLTVAPGGVVDLGASRLTLGGNFSNAGTFIAGTSTVAVVDACGTGASTFTGSTDFYDLVVNTTTGKQLILPTGAKQTVAHALTLQGAAGQLLQVKSTTPGTRAGLVLATGAAQTIDYVNARDIDSRGGPVIAPGQPPVHRSLDGGNLLNWFVAYNGGATPIPTLGGWAMLMLAGLLGMLAFLRHARNPHT